MSVKVYIWGIGPVTARVQRLLQDADDDDDDAWAAAFQADPQFGYLVDNNVDGAWCCAATVDDLADLDAATRFDRGVRHWAVCDEAQ